MRPKRGFEVSHTPCPQKHTFLGHQTQQPIPKDCPATRLSATCKGKDETMQRTASLRLKSTVHKGAKSRQGPPDSFHLHLASEPDANYVTNFVIL